MFGIGTLELMVVGIALLLFVGPKELPTAMRAIGRFVGKVRGYARHFNAGIEAMVREAELEEMEKEWKAQNERIMAQYPGADMPVMTDKRQSDLPLGDEPAADPVSKDGEDKGT